MPKLTKQQQIIYDACDAVIDMAMTGDLNNPLYGVCYHLDIALRQSDFPSIFDAYDIVLFFAYTWQHPYKQQNVIYPIPRSITEAGDYAPKWAGHQLQMRLSLLNHIKSNVHLLTKEALTKFVDDYL